MKLNQIEIGARYVAKVFGQVTVVRVGELNRGPAFRSNRWKTLVYAVNEATRRRITIRSPQRLSRKVGD